MGYHCYDCDVNIYILINTTHPHSLPSDDFCNFLLNDIGLSKEALDLGLRRSLDENAPLAIILWNFGLVNIEQYQSILHWQNPS